MASPRYRFLTVVERVCTIAGGTGLAIVAVAYLHAAIGSHSAIAAFEEAAAVDDQHTVELATSLDAPDQSLWSERAKAKYARAHEPDAALPIALLEIDRLGLKVPVFPGTDALTLNRGAGVVDGTALPGETGNVVISAHRDSYFRSLKDIAAGDVVTLRTLAGVEHFHVTDIAITDPLDVSVLEESPTSTLTLITCYPFYYVGYAPDRFIVRATPLADAP